MIWPLGGSHVWTLLLLCHCVTCQCHPAKDVCPLLSSHPPTPSAWRPWPVWPLLSSAAADQSPFENAERGQGWSRFDVCSFKIASGCVTRWSVTSNVSPISLHWAQVLRCRHRCTFYPLMFHISHQPNQLSVIMLVSKSLVPGWVTLLPPSPFVAQRPSRIHTTLSAVRAPLLQRDRFTDSSKFNLPPHQCHDNARRVYCACRFSSENTA